MPSNGLWYKQGDSWEIRWRSRNRICAHTHTDGLSQFQRHYISLYYCRGTQQRYIYTGLHVAYVSLKRLGKWGKKKKKSVLWPYHVSTQGEMRFSSHSVSKSWLNFFFLLLKYLQHGPAVIMWRKIRSFRKDPMRWELPQDVTGGRGAPVKSVAMVSTWWTHIHWGAAEYFPGRQAIPSGL